MANYQKGFEYLLHDKNITKEDEKELEKLISKFLIDKNYINPKIHKIGTYNLNLESVWKNCIDLIK